MLWAAINRWWCGQKMCKFWPPWARDRGQTGRKLRSRATEKWSGFEEILHQKQNCAHPPPPTQTQTSLGYERWYVESELICAFFKAHWSRIPIGPFTPSIQWQPMGSIYRFPNLATGARSPPEICFLLPSNICYVIFCSQILIFCQEFTICKIHCTFLEGFLRKTDRACPMLWLGSPECFDQVPQSGLPQVPKWLDQVLKSFWSQVSQSALIRFPSVVWSGFPECFLRFPRVLWPGFLEWFSRVPRVAWSGSQDLSALTRSPKVFSGSLECSDQVSQTRLEVS